MVSFENGKFVLRRRGAEDGRSRRTKLLLLPTRPRSIFVVALSLSFAFYHHRRGMMRTAAMRGASSSSSGGGPSRDDDDYVYYDPAAVDGGDGDGTESPLLDGEYLEHLRSLDGIPKIVRVFPSGDIRKEDGHHRLYVELSDLNRPPDWNVTIVDYYGTMANDVIREAASTGLISAVEADMLASAHVAERRDAVDSILMYTEGGCHVGIGKENPFSITSFACERVRNIMRFFGRRRRMWVADILSFFPALSLFPWQMPTDGDPPRPQSSTTSCVRTPASIYPRASATMATTTPISPSAVRR